MDHYKNFYATIPRRKITLCETDMGRQSNQSDSYYNDQTEIIKDDRTRKQGICKRISWKEPSMEPLSLNKRKGSIREERIEEINKSRKRKQCIVKRTIRREYSMEAKETVLEFDCKALYRLLEIKENEEKDRQKTDHQMATNRQNTE